MTEEQNPLFDTEQQTVWNRVSELWSLASYGDMEAIREALHPRYVGWDANQALPHERDEAIASVSFGKGRISRHELTPLSVQVYDHTVGVVHYLYEATVSLDGDSHEVRGRWTEVYLKRDDEWLLIAVHGGPERR